MNHKAIIYTLALTSSLLASPLYASCQVQRNIDQQLDLDQVELIKISVNAGDLIRSGTESDSRIKLTGKICASSQSRADKIKVLARQDGQTAIIETIMPKSGTNLFGYHSSSYVDLKIQVPNTIKLSVNDSSGDIEISGVAAVDLKDSSGDIDISHITGDISVHDSSGDIEIEQVQGGIKVRDSSGDIEIENVTRDVLITNDSSGDINIEQTHGNVVVENDSSGSIYVSDIGGNFTVQNDSSGSIQHKNVSGKIRLPADD